MDTLSDMRPDAETSDPNRSQAEVRHAALTSRQVQVLRCVEHHIAVHGYPPSLRELVAMLGMTSLVGITQHLKALVKKGYIKRDAGQRRGMRVVRASAGAPILDPRPLRKAAPSAADVRRRTA